MPLKALCHCKEDALSNEAISFIMLEIASG
jgi:hypothetical protein